MLVSAQTFLPTASAALFAIFRTDWNAGHRGPAAADIGGQIIRSKTERGDERVGHNRIHVSYTSLRFDLRNDDKMILEILLPSFVVHVAHPIVAHASGAAVAARRHLDGRLHLIQFLRRGDIG